MKPSSHIQSYLDRDSGNGRHVFPVLAEICAFHPGEHLNPQAQPDKTTRILLNPERNGPNQHHRVLDEICAFHPGEYIHPDTTPPDSAIPEEKEFSKMGMFMPY